jgi:hypothetical protein
MGEICSLETSMPTYQTTEPCHNPEYYNTNFWKSHARYWLYLANVYQTRYADFMLSHYTSTKFYPSQPIGFGVRNK